MDAVSGTRIRLYINVTKKLKQGFIGLKVCSKNKIEWLIMDGSCMYNCCIKRLGHNF
jgi:hypothetical protein